MKNCESCDCFRLYGATNGFCHRLPPKVVVVGDDLKTVWPEVDATEGCGYHVAKRNELDIPWPRLWLSSLRGTPTLRVRNALDSANIATANQLLEKSADDLLELRHFGHTCLGEVREALAANDLKLKGD